jgi:hypothetical protein
MEMRYVFCEAGIAFVMLFKRNSCFQDLRSMSWEHVAYMGEMRNAYRFSRNSEGKLLGKPAYR